jgi:hypothetical protein
MRTKNNMTNLSRKYSIFVINNGDINIQLDQLEIKGLRYARSLFSVPSDERRIKLERFLEGLLSNYGMYNDENHHALYIRINSLLCVFPEIAF